MEHIFVLLRGGGIDIGIEVDRLAVEPLCREPHCPLGEGDFFAESLSALYDDVLQPEFCFRIFLPDENIIGSRYEIEGNFAGTSVAGHLLGGVLVPGGLVDPRINVDSFALGVHGVEDEFSLGEGNLLVQFFSILDLEFNVRCCPRLGCCDLCPVVPRQKGLCFPVGAGEGVHCLT